MSPAIPDSKIPMGPPQTPSPQPPSPRSPRGTPQGPSPAPRARVPTQVEQMFAVTPIDASGNIDYKSLCYIITHGDEKED